MAPRMLLFGWLCMTGVLLVLDHFGAPDGSVDVAAVVCAVDQSTRLMGLRRGGTGSDDCLRRSEWRMGRGGR